MGLSGLPDRNPTTSLLLLPPSPTYNERSHQQMPCLPMTTTTVAPAADAGLAPSLSKKPGQGRTHVMSSGGTRPQSIFSPRYTCPILLGSAPGQPSTIAPVPPAQCSLSKPSKKRKTHFSNFSRLTLQPSLHCAYLQFQDLLERVTRTRQSAVSSLRGETPPLRLCLPREQEQSRQAADRLTSSTTAAALRHR